MTRFLLALAFTVISGGVLSANSVVDCSGNATAVNNCYQSKLPNFTTQLDWAVFGAADGTIHNGVWTANDVAGTLDVSVSGQGLVHPTDEGLRLGYNFATVFFGGQWTEASSIPGAGYTVAGHFNQTSNPSAALAALQADPSIHLLGLALNGVSADRQLLLDFSEGIATFGFFASSALQSNFDLRVQVFAGVGGTGPLLADSPFSYSGVGGICAGMLSAPNAPTGCNDAPFISGSGFVNGGIGTARSILISSSDPAGLYLSNLQFAAVPVPEPGPMILCGLGLALMVIRGKRLRRSRR